MIIALVMSELSTQKRREADQAGTLRHMFSKADKNIRKTPDLTLAVHIQGDQLYLCGSKHVGRNVDTVRYVF